VVKPLNANHGRGVTLHITDDDQLVSAFTAARAHSTRVIVEEQLSGDDYRFLVVGGKVVAVARRKPASIIGDGVHTVVALVARENEDPRRGAGHENVLTKLQIDPATERVLAGQGLAPSSIPEVGRLVLLRDTANLSTGGTAEDCTESVHPDTMFLMEQVAATIGLDVAGIDFLSPDITRPIAETGGGVVEVRVYACILHLQRASPATSRLPSSIFSIDAPARAEYRSSPLLEPTENRPLPAR